jgi:hypothetical protein
MTSKLTILQAYNATDFFTPWPIECPECHVQSCWFRNQYGRSICIACALQPKGLPHE